MFCSLGGRSALERLSEDICAGGVSEDARDVECTLAEFDVAGKCLRSWSIRYIACTALRELWINIRNRGMNDIGTLKMRWSQRAVPCIMDGASQAWI